MLKSEIIAQMPKVELHCHLDGSLSLSVIKELAKNAGIHMTMSDEEILKIVENNFDFRVGNILSELDLRRPIYKRTACYGHFGDPAFPWEQVKELKY